MTNAIDFQAWPFAVGQSLETNLAKNLSERSPNVAFLSTRDKLGLVDEGNARNLCQPPFFYQHKREGGHEKKDFIGMFALAKDSGSTKTLRGIEIASLKAIRIMLGYIFSSHSCIRGRKPLHFEAD